MHIREYLRRGARYILHGVPQRVVRATVAVLPPEELLAGRTALVTGGTGGIGQAVARALMAAGARVVVTSRSAGRAAEAAARLNAEAAGETRAWGIALDNRRPQDFAAALDMAETLAGPIDTLVNNAGRLGGHIALATPEEYDDILGTNLRGPFFLTREVARRMKERGAGGNILNIASSSSLRPADSAYTLSKWGIRGLTLGMAKTLAPLGITVNAIAPGPTATAMLGRDAGGDIACPKIPLGRCALPEEVAAMAVTLVSDMGRTIVGDTIYMTGGAGLLTYEDNHYFF